MSKNLQTRSGQMIHIQNNSEASIATILSENRSLSQEAERSFFDPKISDLHDPFLMVDMEAAVKRILIAREK